MIVNIKQKFNCYGIIIVLSALMLISSFDLSGEESAEKNLLCKPINTDLKHIDKQQVLDWLKEFDRRYGTVKNVIAKIEVYENQKNLNVKPFDKNFYDKYGAYVYLTLPSMKSKNRLIVIKHLLSNGVHPYETVFGIDHIAGTVVSFEDVEGLKLLIESGKLIDCKSHLNDLYVIAERTKNKKIINLIEGVLNKLN